MQLESISLVGFEHSGSRTPAEVFQDCKDERDHSSLSRSSILVGGRTGARPTTLQ